MEFEKNTIPVISTTECQQNDITETFINLSPEEAGREVISTVEENFKLLEHLGRKIEEARCSADKANENAALAADKKIGFFGGGKADEVGLETDPHPRPHEIKAADGVDGRGECLSHGIVFVIAALANADVNHIFLPFTVLLGVSRRTASFSPLYHTR